MICLICMIVYMQNSEWCRSRCGAGRPGLLPRHLDFLAPGLRELLAALPRGSFGLAQRRVRHVPRRLRESLSFHSVSLPKLTSLKMSLRDYLLIVIYLNRSILCLVRVRKESQMEMSLWYHLLVESKSECHTPWRRPPGSGDVLLACHWHRGGSHRASALPWPSKASCPPA